MHLVSRGIYARRSSIGEAGAEAERDAELECIPNRGCNYPETAGDPEVDISYQSYPKLYYFVHQSFLEDTWGSNLW